MTRCEKYQEAEGKVGDEANQPGICTLKERAPDIPQRYAGPEAPARECKGDVGKCPFTLFNYW